MPTVPPSFVPVDDSYPPDHVPWAYRGEVDRRFWVVYSWAGTRGHLLPFGVTSRMTYCRRFDARWFGRDVGTREKAHRFPLCQKCESTVSAYDLQKIELSEC